MEKILENQFLVSDCKHLRSLLNSKNFEGTLEERSYLLKSLEHLELEFSNLPKNISIEEVLPEWYKRYSPIKFQVYKAYGYVAPKSIS